MISKNTIKLINSLSLRKYRLKEKLFLAEGDKIVSLIMKSGITIEKLFATEEFLRKNMEDSGARLQALEVDHREIKKASLLKNPQNSLAICRLPDETPFPEQITGELSLFLDGIQDPGNLGTIIRICDWFGIKDLYCSENSADLYNPKVIQASMGSFTGISVRYCPFEKVKELAVKSRATIFGAFADGTNLYENKLPDKALLVMGNEGNGISPDVEKQLEYKIGIPGFTKERKAESLNVSVATAVICSEFKRQVHF